MEYALKKADEYKNSASKFRLGHYIAAESAARKNKVLGIPSVIISAVVATSVFSTMSDNVDIIWRIATGVTALCAAVLVSLQTFLNYGDLAERHHKAASRYYNVARRLDMFYLNFHDKDDGSKETAIEELREITETLAALSSDSPSIAEKIYTQAVKQHGCESGVSSDSS